MIRKYGDAEAEPMRKCFGEVPAFIEENETTPIGMADEITGCPHEEGLDYPAGGGNPNVCLLERA